MEEYEEFCEKALARVQEASLSTESFLPAQAESVSLIRFHGVAVLSPLLTTEKRKAIQQEKQKALDVQTRKQSNRKKALLTRVQEILENVQVRKAPNASDFDQWATETIYSNPAVRSLDAPATVPNSLPSPTEHCTSVKLEKITGLWPVGNKDQCNPNGLSLPRDSEGSGSPKRCESPDSRQAENGAAPRFSAESSQETLISDDPLLAKEEPDPSCLPEGTPDPYIMSLQNLMKKSKEYVEREQSRRSLRGSTKRTVSESHSDKENDAAKASDCVKEKAPPIPTGRHCGSAIPDKPSLNKSNVLLQGASQASNMGMSVLGNFSKVDLPVGTDSPAVPDAESDFKVIPTLITENKVIKSLTGPYAKLPSPEPSVSPTMLRRRSRPSSACQILINNPVNACELSPKGKEEAGGRVAPADTETTNESEIVPKSPADLAGVCSSKVSASKIALDPTRDTVVGKTSQVHQALGNQLDNKATVEDAAMEGPFTPDEGGVQKVDSTCMAVPTLHELHTTRQCVASQTAEDVCGLKSASMSAKNSCNLQMELNKSYDVKNPSPLLMQTQNSRQQMDTSPVPCGNEQFLDNTFEKVKRRLDLDIDSLQKENCPYIITAGVAEQEREHLPERRYPKGSVCINKNKMLETSPKEGQEILKSKMLAFEEMRKRLEEQHAQQLSLLIAEQEREQERLQREIEEQGKMLREKVAASDVSDSHTTLELEWRKRSGSALLDTMLSQVDLLRTPDNSDFTNSALQYSFGSASEAPFYLWGSLASGVTKLSGTRPFGRTQAKRSQVFSPEIQAKFNKITAVARGFLTRKLMQTDKLKRLRQTVKDTMEFMRSFQSEAPLKRGVVSAQDASLQERVLAQLRAALYGIHDIFFVMDAAERMSILRHDREARKEKLLRQMDKMKSPRVALSAATQKSLDRKKFMKVAEMGMPNKKFLLKQNPSETRVLQPNQGQNAPVHRLLSRQGTPKTSVKGVVQTRQKPSQSRVPNRAPMSGAYAGKIQRKRPNVATI
ncbi:centriolar coiled-coil protein of 110 kDa isoform X1 [Peromyscus californicus insignis]|uniref:centriolar coiled-coil protein of 110 kDa isoform X1 n=1 Tax=Peromyscus californicus insignis TaxID=564181 RepID=UPI0022A6DDF3|nr:centriolar coiled-coil protein of 110 kDa isoform X1 [Peromyscus californicus insignis]XP_052618196.1 centriolar coiled-coil protein of 110 kDa isoform X1 [Peromyscus californicus insignis]